MHRRKMIMILALIFGTSLILSGCSWEKTKEKMAEKIASVVIPFEWFRLEPEKIEKTEIPKIIGMDLTEEPVDTEGLKAFTELVRQAEKLLTDHEDYLAIASGKKSLFQVLGSSLLSYHYNTDSDGITETIKDFAKTEYQWIGSLTLRQYGYRLNEEGERIGYAVVDINGVNDTDKFHIQTVQLELDGSNLPKEAIRIGEPVDRSHTRTPLRIDSFLEIDTHLQFHREWEKLYPVFQDITLYEKIAKEEINASHEDVKKLVEKMGFPEEVKSTIFSLLKNGKGTFEHWGVTGYLFDDTDLSAMTYYELSVADESGIHRYTIHYHRGKKEITKITKGSPFKEEEK